MQGWAKVKDAARYADVSERTFRSWIKHGLCHSRLPSGMIRVQYSAIDEFLNTFAVSDNEVENLTDEILEGIL